MTIKTSRPKVQWAYCERLCHARTPKFAEAFSSPCYTHTDRINKYTFFSCEGFSLSCEFLRVYGQAQRYFDALINICLV